MRRWNGWGDEGFTYHLPQSAIPTLIAWVGQGTRPQDATLDQVIATVPASRLPDHPLINTDALVRLRHARGQSLPDWLALRSCRVEVFPDGVAVPATDSDVRTLLDWANQHQVALIPYGGGTSVVGHINPLPGEQPVLTVDMQRLNQLRWVDKVSHLAAFGAGVNGPDLEAHLRAHSLTLGHFPQSFECSTLGGWVVTRSSGQQSYRYGKIERTFAGGRLETPVGTLVIKPLPASAAGLDLREWVLGSEGRMGFLVEAIIRVTPLPEEESFHALFFPHFEAGVAAVRQIVQERVPASMLRLSTAVETATNLALAGHEQLIGLMQRGLGLLGQGDEKCMLMLGISGSEQLARSARRMALHIAHGHGGFHVGRYMGHQWHKTRFTTPYLRNTMWELGYAVDTVETAAPWGQLPALINNLDAALRVAMEGANERVHVFTHVSHVYPDGASIYTTYVFRVQPDPGQTLEFWCKLKTAASEAIVAGGGTISHQHGVGLDHRSYLQTEKGALGMAALTTACRTFDPGGIMNPGKLIGRSA